VGPETILFLSNGHGEDTIAVKIIDRLRRSGQCRLEMVAWPMVGRGEAYRRIGIPVIGPFNLLPSCGFATLSLKWLWRDLKAGWIATHLRQVRAARRLRQRYRLAVAVGDIVVMAAAVLGRLPFFFVGCAKSSYYSSLHGYTRLEKYLLRRYCLLAFPRDELTVGELDRAGVKNEYVGNPMMDDLEARDSDFGIPAAAPVIGLLPGSRNDAPGNALHLLLAVDRIDPADLPGPIHFLFAAADSLDTGRIAADVGRGRGGNWKVEEQDGSSGIVLKLGNSSGLKAQFVKGRFADVLHRSSLVVGTAGTANEQAIGLGKPLITFPSRGVMGPQYVNMKMKLFGPAALRVSPQPEEIAAAVVTLLKDRDRQETMAAAGRRRMGRPGASEAIARRILRYLDEPNGPPPGGSRS
jgi:uncharacterized protein (TIGR03492 family)